jgi:hypothetical protein
VNGLIPDDKLALPKINELFARLHGFSIASALDLKQSYHQFSLDLEDQIKTTFTWPRGGGANCRYMFAGCPFGLKPLTHLFQSAMEQMLEGCEAFVVIFVDDIIVFSRDSGLHAEHVSTVIDRLTEWNLTLNAEKSHFGYLRLRVLGHLVSGEGRSPDPRKLSSLLSYPVPDSPKQLSAFLGFVNYLRDYVPHYASIAAPLEALRNAPPREFNRLWLASPACLESFETFKTVLASSVVLAFPLDGHPYFVLTDASQTGLGVVLYQEVDGAARYITFVSKSLTGAQRNYGASKRELLGIVFALQRLRQYLYATHFTLVTDHKALTYMFSQQNISHGWRTGLMSC